ncbi:TIGR03087 family PEP-CTERM/XrtA system glycosyltransferase [Desertibaculum subflavum]|uniref:TIGR03087 family PEP-CTERM/XrtA system glycosyltransferase n=1 Tax=Desertibaculum subflavum TaxID=2268458 RepID=UPI000E674D08
MQDLLFLSQRIPYPPNKGDKIRSWNILAHLRRSFRIHLGCFIDDPHDRQYTAKLTEICGGECHFVTLDPRLAKLRSLISLATGDSLTRRYFHDAGLAAWVDQIVLRHQPAHVFCYSSAVAPYVLNQRRIAPSRCMIDFVDVDSDKWLQYAETARLPMRWIYRREGRTLLKLEREAAAGFGAVILCSRNEADLFRKLAPESAAKVVHANNGVDTDFFDPEGAYDNPYGAGPVYAFTGAMDYWPNVDAVQWFADEIFPKVREARPAARFAIVGTNPTEAVKALGTRDGILVTGRVPDIRPYIAHAEAVVVPLRIARGIQNKVLEAMAMRRFIVAAGPAMQGVEPAARTHLRVADDAATFARHLLETDPATRVALGQSAGDYVRQAYGWAANLAVIDRALARLG